MLFCLDQNAVFDNDLLLALSVLVYIRKDESSILFFISIQ